MPSEQSNEEPATCKPPKTHHLKSNKLVETKADKENTVNESTKLHNATTVADLVCPITLELPFEAVMGEDGCVYEKQAIQKYFTSTGTSAHVKSPVTGVLMSKRIFPAPLIKNHIEALIEKGVVEDELASKWKEKAAQKNVTAAILKKAKGGDVDQMVQLGWYYRDGLNGFERHTSLSFQWFEKAHIAGHPVGTACVGHMLVKGLGVKPNLQKGTTYLALAAGQGSDYAAYQLGSILAGGSAGLPRDVAEARRLLERALGPCTYSNLNEAGRKKAQDKLNKLLQRHGH